MSVCSFSCKQSIHLVAPFLRSLTVRSNLNAIVVQHKRNVHGFNHQNGDLFYRYSGLNVLMPLCWEQVTAKRVSWHIFDREKLLPMPLVRYLLLQTNHKWFLNMVLLENIIFTRLQVHCAMCRAAIAAQRISLYTPTLTTNVTDFSSAKTSNFSLQLETSERVSHLPKPTLTQTHHKK